MLLSVACNFKYINTRLEFAEIDAGILIWVLAIIQLLSLHIKELHGHCSCIECTLYN